MKKLLVLLFILVSIVGFMMKLPSVFRDYDKELHLLFYLATAVSLSILFAYRNYFYHVMTLIGLFCFGVFIEYCQEVSNSFVGKKIHGNFDIEDVIFNTLGLFIAFFIWTSFVVLRGMIKKVRQWLQ
jgi:VanZ family protein